MTLLEEVKSYKEKGILRFAIPNIVKQFEKITEKWHDICRNGHANDQSLLNELTDEIIFLLENGTE